METRYLIVQYATMLEELCSLYLCELLQIDKKSSISFGYGSQSLSFNAKVNLITDLSKTDKKLKAKFILFAEIRNKFAHVFDVSSFKAFCSLGKDWEKKGKDLLNFYEIESIPNEEVHFTLAYILLYKELEKYITHLSFESAHNRGYIQGRLDALEKYKEIVRKELFKMPKGKEILSKYLKEFE
ncbi:hypothetical protein [Chryseobacterium potabilaquae]|uniref:Uncharacterized protein n=1 Tax=Chryseobacterium potabilaquae TaxID=2675057 RepID=A0A6N4XB90_9FLAO|nr:hypothetical protein [Chryseobacterium potabilaquae]CAA7196266.1 hypothetical protein CHRY9293_02373 [Chryseobacterium potabilaquae]